MLAKPNSGRLILLGTGSSMGVPVVGCECQVCQSNHPKNIRNRCCALIEFNDKTFLVDCGPDFHRQGLKHHITSLDGVIFTHAHFDHIAGIDELRLYFFRRQAPLPALALESTYQDLQTRFAYLFKKPEKKESVAAQFDFTQLCSSRGQIDFEGLPLQFFSFHQGSMEVMGFRLGSLAYVCDIKTYPASLVKDLQGVETLVLSALRRRSSHVHFSIDQALEFADQLGVSELYLTHLDHEVDFEKEQENLPEGRFLAYDDQVLNFHLK